MALCMYSCFQICIHSQSLRCRCIQHRRAHGAIPLKSVLAQPLVKNIRHVPNLKIGHSMILA